MKQKLFFGIFVLVFCLFGAACQFEAAVETKLPVSAVDRAPVIVQPVEAVPLAVVVEEAMAKTAVTTVKRETAVSAAPEPVAKLAEAEVPATEQENIVASASQASSIVHEVAEGEWIYELARCYGSTPRAIIMANHLR
ncbi:MAG: hypothetical protein KC421_19960, partial [Anaerolineales bacterium]|nr:hypothetical protein [Anaerolineales bacterium]